ncbi:11324_t:CDS:2 [Funneliformis mosseae]|uniref:11324_t:CDS:1 n=1 Tax=Funneliformis mosseae TaxID=27381 RepID=A0A9N9CRJ1_FUNMO|nr:11324_t:CDS:2 [Funneliformis mosseae]
MPQPKVKILGVVYGIGMNINNIIGSGIVTVPGIIWNSVQSPTVVLILWVIGGLVSMLGSLSYVELGVKHKISGGETKYLQTAFPNPKYCISYLFSFMCITAIKPAITSAVLQSAAQYFWYTIKEDQYKYEIKYEKIGWTLPFSPFWTIKLIAIAILFVITAYHMINNRLANMINQSLAIIKLITYTMIAIAGLFQLSTDTSRNNWQYSKSVNTDFTAYSSAFLLVMFSYNGWNTLNYSLDEFKKVEKKLLFSNSISVLIVTVLYFFVNVAYISVVTQEYVFNHENENEVIGAIFFNNLFNDRKSIVRIFTFLIVLSVIGTAASNIWSGSRVIVAAAESDYFLSRYSRKLSTLHESRDTPINALLAQFIWCSMFILMGSSFTITSFQFYSKFSIYSGWIFYFATGIGLLVIRNRENKKLQKNKMDKSDSELDLNHDENSETSEVNKLYTAPLSLVWLFVLVGLFIIISAFIVQVHCSSDPHDCKKDRIHKMTPFLFSYAFLFAALTFWYYYWWKSKKNEA